MLPDIVGKSRPVEHHIGFWALKGQEAYVHVECVSAHKLYATALQLGSRPPVIAASYLLCVCIATD